jgi:hypothetical protein
MLMVLAAVAALPACSTQAPPAGAGGAPNPVEVRAQQRERLTASIRECTQRTGYDPNAGQRLAPYALGRNELEWRQCAYDAVRAYAQATPPLRGQYEQLIAEDASMTAAIQQRTMTRAQRRARIDTLVEQIRGSEEGLAAAEASATQADQSRRTELTRQVVDNVRMFGN